MAEALGIISGAVQIADVLVRFSRYLNDIRKDAAGIDDYILSLLSEIDGLHHAVNSVQENFEAELNSPSPLKKSTDRAATDALWKRVDVSLQSCLGGVTALESVIEEVCGSSDQSRIGSFAKAHRKRSKKDSIRQCRDQIASYQRNLLLLLQTIAIKNGQASSESLQQLSRNLSNYSREVQSSIDGLHTQDPAPTSFEQQLDYTTLSAFRDLKASIDSATTAITAVSSNEFFDIPVPVSSIFTGREKLLEEVRKFFIGPLNINRDSYQRRFVVFGIGGSGKTQFSCKFAEQNRDSFWGVFWIDASSEKRIKQTLANIAALAKVGTTAEAALFWLGNVKQRWLLLIDNADNDNIDLEQYFPTNNRGHILITTRRQSLTVLGNVGPSYFSFEKLDVEDANMLLLRAADKHDFRNVSVVNQITKTLNFLALAIIQAGAAVRRKLCTLEEYLVVFENSWKRISRNILRRDYNDNSPLKEVYSSWEINYTYLEKDAKKIRMDAIELLKTFAFFHRDKIRFEILNRALLNKEKEKKEEEKQAKFEDDGEKLSWFRTVTVLCYSGFSTNRPEILPRLVRAGRKEEEPEVYTYELRRALAELVESSLIGHDDTTDTYYMHPLQHRYARFRLSLPEQGLYAEAAATVLSASILLPPLGAGTDHEDFNRDLIPHIDQVLRCREEIVTEMSKQRQQLWFWKRWVTPSSVFTRDRAVMYAKFSLPFMQNGRYEDAETLQQPVKEFLHSLLGPEHSKSRAISSALAHALERQGRAEEGANMQRSVLTICENRFGRHHLITLRAKQMLAHIIFTQGFYGSARAMLKEVVDGFSKILGPKDEETLKAKEVYGRAVGKFWTIEDFQLACTVYREAISGLTEIHGPDNFEMLLAKEGLARLQVDVGGETFFEEANLLIMDVLTRRKKNLGNEHPYTLLAMVHTSIIKCARGEAQEGERLLREGLAIAERNYGRDHIGTLLGRLHLGHVLLHLGRFKEAEDILRDTTERQKYMQAKRGDYHPDRVSGLIELAKSYRLQGKIELSIQTCDEAIDGFETWGTVDDHTLVVDLREARSKLARHQELLRQGQAGIADISEPPRGAYRPWRVF